MGLLDQVGSAVSGATGKSAAGGGMNAMLLQQLMSMLNKPGGMDGLLGAFRGGGLGNIVQSWIGTGQNMPISPEQVTSVLGQNTVSDLAQKAGVGEADAANALSGLLPEMVDKLTPEGKVPSQLDFGSLPSSLGKLLS